MTNLLKETRSAIKKSSHCHCDIAFIGSMDGKYECTWPQFIKLADFEYDSGFGGEEVATDLVIVFTDGNIMRRGEYDGSEWWEWNPTFTKADTTKKIRTLTPNGSWRTVEELQ